ncbi:aldehyde dehydrogenase family protein, partial [bacterium AH-315-F18]|nr:aldehyde dehydrogenase family protein [bacterium AH-315-F18]
MSQHNTAFQIPRPRNEAVRPYAPSDAETASVKGALKHHASEKIDIPLIIGGKEVRTGTLKQQVEPHAHAHVLCDYHQAGTAELTAAADAAATARPGWEAMAWQDRAAIFLKAADLLAGPRRDELNATTMLGQSKNVFQAEIDAACEFIDFLRFNASFYQDILEDQPQSAPGIWNRLDYRPLEGFVLAITPFNFTSIAGNLPCAPAMLGNTVVWKPSSTQVYSAWVIMDILKEAGLPDGVINFIPSSGRDVSATLLSRPDLAGVHFTGSTAVFKDIYRTVGEHLGANNGYPRIVGETGGKDFIFAHASADVEVLATAMLRGAFEYQGQKCSAASRAFVPKSLWGPVKDKLLADTATLKMGDVRDFSNFVNAVIDKSS